MSRLLASLLLLALLGPWRVLAGEPPTDPILRVETGAHTAVINKLAVTRDGKLLTVSDDKTARLWSRAGGTPRIIRVPIGPGSEGALYAVATSPTKDIAVVGGFTGLSWDRAGSVYGVDLSTGRMSGRVETPPAKIYALAYSNDGRYLAIGTDEKAAVRVLDLTARSVALEDSAYGGAVTTVQFLPDGRLVTASLDGKVRLYDVSFHLAGSYTLPNKAHPWRIATAPEGDRIAVGAVNAPIVQVLSTDGLKPVATLSAGGGHGGALPAVAWVGTRVFAAGADGNSNQNRLYMWDMSSGKKTEAVLASDTVSDLAALPDGTIAFATAEPSLGIFDPRTLTTTWMSKRSIGDFRDAGDAFKVAADGSAVQFPTQQKGRGPLRFDLPERTLTADPPERSAMTAPGGPCGLKHWQNLHDPSYQGSPIALQPDENARSVAATLDCSTILLGADYSLRLMHGPHVAWTVSLQAPAWAVNLTKDKRYALAALGDGTIRWYNTKDGAEVLALFATTDRRWIAWTTEGYFDHGPNAQDLVGYHVNRGKAADPDFTRSGQVYSRFFRPDLMTLKLRGEDLSTAVAKTGDVQSVVATHAAPELHLVRWCVHGKCSDDASGGTVGPDGTVRVDAADVTLRIAAKDRGSGIGKVVVRRNGAAVPTRSTPTQDTTTTHIEDDVVNLAPGENHLTVTASDKQQMVDAGAPISIAFLYQAPPQTVPAGTDRSNLPKLHLLAIGINYENHPNNRLENAVNDAKGVAQTMSELHRDLFRAGRTEVLTEQQATLTNIGGAFQRIAAEAEPEDVVLVFLAGHGIAIDGKFYFLVYDSTLTADGAQATGLTHDKLAEFISTLPTARVAVLIDSCFAGAFAVPDAALRQSADVTSRDRAWMGQLGNATGRFILAGSQNQQEALDGVNGHGVFTGVVLEGIKGQADIDHDGEVDVSELSSYAKSHVPEEARKIAPDHDQKATFYFAGSDFFKLSNPGTHP